MDSTTPEAGMLYARMAAEKLLDEQRPKMIECLAAAFYGDQNGSVGFIHHFQNGDHQRTRATSDFGLS